jgi:hypothetical protein
MNPKMRRNFSGDFAAQDLGKQVWRLSQGAPHRIDVIVQGTRQGATPSSVARAFGTEPVTNLGIEWHSDMALLSFMSGDRVETVEGANVIVHEPLRHLYEGLPLAQFDQKAKVFWGRVFRLVRIPGGRLLLRFLAR